MRSLPLLVALSLSVAARAEEPLKVDPKDLPRYPAVEPGEAVKTFQVRPGFHVELAASEPFIGSPIAVSFDENGRMFVLEMRDYSEQRDVTPHLGRVSLLEDTDGDGKYDKATVFADDLAWPTGLIWANGGLFVVATPDIIRFEDRDGDGKAEKREVIYTGLQSEAARLNVQGLPNCFQWGPDNLIHLQMSTAPRSRIRRPSDKAEVPVASGDFYFDPKTYAWGTEAAGGQYGMSYDNYGRRFTCSNSDHLQMYVYDSREAAGLNLPSPRVSIAADGPAAEVYRLSPDEPWRIIRTRWRVSGAVKGVVEGGGRVSGYFTGATGTTVYRGDAFGPEYLNDTFTGDAGGGLVHHKRLKPDGVSLIGARPPGEEKLEFVASRDTWFRPVNFANAPDGTLYIIDMYREVIEHPWSIPQEIKEHLDLTSGRDRGRIWRLAPDEFKAKPAPQLGKASTEELIAALSSPNGWTRDTATRLLVERGKLEGSTTVDSLLAVVKSGTSPLGRLHALRLLGATGRVWDAISIGLQDSDAGVRELALSLITKAPAKGVPVDLWPRLLAISQKDPSERVQLELIFAIRKTAHPEASAALANLGRRNPGNKWIQAAIVACADPGSLFKELAKDLAFCAKPEAEPLLTGLAKIIATQNAPENADVLRLSRQTPLRFALVASFVEGKVGHTGKRASIGDDEIYAEARAAALDPAKPLSIRAAAVRLLAFNTPEESTADLLSLLQNTDAPSLRPLALDSLGHYPMTPELMAALFARWKNLDPAGKATLFRFLAARKPTARALLASIERGEIPVAEVGTAEGLLLQSSKDPEIAALAAKLLPKPTAGTRAEVIKLFEPALMLTGDQAKGHVTYTQRCSICHRLRGEGTAFGPDLESVLPGGKEKILTHLIDPNREVATQFSAYTVEMKDGSALAGIIASETPTQVTLREPLGKESQLARETIARLQTTGRSPMPEGLEAGLTNQDMADLLAFLVGS